MGIQGTPDNPGVVMRPPRLFALFMMLGIALFVAWPVALFSSVARGSIGPILIGLGVIVMTLAVRRFGSAGTNVPTCLPAETIVTDGIYRYTRNPMYLSGMLMFAGIAIATGNPWMLALVIPFFLIIRYGVIAREERYLEGKFGERYLRYKASVRRWL